MFSGALVQIPIYGGKERKGNERKGKERKGREGKGRWALFRMLYASTLALGSALEVFLT